jgi:hypothetical protein
MLMISDASISRWTSCFIVVAIGGTQFISSGFSLDRAGMEYPSIKVGAYYASSSLIDGLPRFLRAFTLPIYAMISIRWAKAFLVFTELPDIGLSL